MNRLTADDGDTFLSLSEWQSLTGQDGNSIISTPAELFVSAATDDYHLASSSPAIDSGTGGLLTAREDLESHPRPLDGDIDGSVAWDLGAYEYVPTLTYNAWQSLHYTPTQIANPSVSGPQADSNDDGTRNLLAYALGLDPWTYTREGLPTETTVNNKPGITFRQQYGTTDIQIGVEQSSNMTTWSEALPMSGDPLNNGDGTETLIYTSATPLEANERVFIRMRVVLTET